MDARLQAARRDAASGDPEAVARYTHLLERAGKIDVLTRLDNRQIQHVRNFAHAVALHPDRQQDFIDIITNGLNNPDDFLHTIFNRWKRLTEFRKEKITLHVLVMSTIDYRMTYHSYADEIFATTMAISLGKRLKAAGHQHPFTWLPDGIRLEEEDV